MMTKNAANLPNRRRIVDPDHVDPPVYVLSDRHDRIEGSWHAHERLQLLHVSEGVLTMETPAMRVVIPPQRAAWILPGIEHRIAARVPFWLTTCYINQAVTGFVPGPAALVTVDDLTDALLVAVGRFGEAGPQTAPDRRKVAVLCDCLGSLSGRDILLPRARSGRLGRLTGLLLADPARTEPLAELAPRAGLTERTAARLFSEETGLSFGLWRTTLRMQVALEHLSTGESVTQTAFAVGYRDVSSFIEAFDRIFGVTPSNVLKARARERG